jgi:hypothetical protein
MPERKQETSMTQESIDITGLNFQQLEELRNRLEHRVTEMRETGAPALREQWGEQAAAIGMTIEEILQAGKKRGRGNGGKHQQEAVA